MKISRPFASGILLAVLLALCLGCPGAARAGAGEFRRHYQRALKLYESQRYQDAIGEFRLAYGERQLPRLLFNIGQAHRKLGQAREVIEVFDAYLKADSKPSPELRREAEEAIAQARAQLQAAERLRTSQRPLDLSAAAPPPPPPPRPVYKRWWFWTLIGVAGAGVTAGVLAGTLAPRSDLAGLDVRTLRF